MAKRMNLTIRLKNITDQTLAVAHTVIGPKGQVPVKAKKVSHIESILLAADQGKVEILSHGIEALAAIIGATRPAPVEAVEEIDAEFADIDAVGPVKPQGEQQVDVKPEGSEENPGDAPVEPQGEPQTDEKSEDEPEDKPEGELENGPEDKPEDKPAPAKKPAAKKAPAKK